MKMDDKTGGPAFPRAHDSNADDARGMALRDYFAAKAMASMIVNEVDATIPALAARSYTVADAMLEARNK